MRIRFFYDETTWRLKSSRKVKKLIVRVIEEENYIPGDLNFIFTDDKSILEINREFLKHNFYTDVITFREIQKRQISGEVYIGIETVKRNAINYNVSYKQEILRVIIHGALHLCDYDDRSKGGKSIMRAKEDFWLKYFEGEYNELRV